MKAHFFDIDTLLIMDTKAWIISKSDPSNAIMKINKAEFNIIKSGIYRSQNNKVDFNGNIFWLPDSIMSRLMVLIKNRKLKLSDMAISLREFIDEDIINAKEFTLDMRIIKTIKNSGDDVYIICPKETKQTYARIIERIVDRLVEDGIVIKKFYHISETFYNQNNDDIQYKKIALFVQHLVGYKTTDKKFIDEVLVRYDTLSYYGNDKSTCTYVDKINQTFRELYIKTDDILKSIIREDILIDRPHFVANQVTDNIMNAMISSETSLVINSYIKTSIMFKKEEEESE